MPARLLAGKASTILPGLTCGLYGIYDSRVARAAAKVARKSLLDRFAISRAALLQHRRRTDDNPGNTESALHSPFQHEGLSQNIPHILRNALEGDHLASFYLFRFSQAGQYRAAINKHRAATARTFGRATILWGNDATLFPKDFQQMHAWFVRNIY